MAPALHSSATRSIALRERGTGGRSAVTSVRSGFGGSALFNILYCQHLQTLIVINHESYTARNEHLYALLKGADIHYFWSDPDINHPADGWTEEAFRSPWEFDVERNREPLTELLRHLGAYYARYGTPEIARPWDTDELLGVVGLSAQANARIGNLSGGQRRRLDVAIGIVGRPELLFLDEPTAGFDPAARREFHELVHRLTDLERATVLLTTHDLAEAEKLADRVIILAGGTIIADGSPDELALRLSAQAEVRWARPNSFLIGDEVFEQD